MEKKSTRKFSTVIPTQIKEFFAACIYLRKVTRSGTINVSFVTAKTHMKPIRIPGNLILVQLVKSVILALVSDTRIVVVLLLE